MGVTVRDVSRDAITPIDVYAGAALGEAAVRLGEVDVPP